MIRRRPLCRDGLCACLLLLLVLLKLLLKLLLLLQLLLQLVGLVHRIHLCLGNQWTAHRRRYIRVNVIRLRPVVSAI